MSNLINCQSLTKSFGSQTLFEDIDIVINNGDRIGLIGPNGSGKSTLLKILCQHEDVDQGTILMKKHMVVSYLAQSDVFEDEKSIVENLHTFLDDSDLEEMEKYNRINAVLSRAEFDNTSQTVSLLSGGWRKRLAICRSLLASSEVLVMDEPTNHLDIEGIIWLEKLLSTGINNGPSAFLLVSHDRQFLENCTNRIVELSAVYAQGSFQVNGQYSVFLEKRELLLQQQLQMEDRLSNKVRRETEWLRRGPKARTTKARYRIDEAHRLQDELTLVKGRNRAASNVRIDFDGTGRKTKKLLEGKGLSKSFDGDLLFSDLDILLSPGTRLGLLGRNGCGKSTLMQILAASVSSEGVELDSGSINAADNISIVSFDQKRESLDPNLTLRRALAPDGDSIVFRDRSVHVVSWAKRFLFQAEHLETPVGQLSGGEQARILIANLMRQPADILLLDEPTNDLDIDSLDVLEESLMDFPGALVLVTHDRFLLDKVCDKLLGFDGLGGLAYYADYEQWLSHIAKMKNTAEPDQTSGVVEKETKRKGRQKVGKLSYLDQREYDQMEDKISEAEATLEEIQKEMEADKTAADPHRLEECWQRQQKLQHEIEKLYDRWDELEEKKNAS